MKDYKKLYEESLKRAKAAIDIAADKDLVKGVAKTIFPELSESEEEKMRKWLVDYFKEVGKSWIHRDITCEQILEWLEKQKEPENVSASTMAPSCWEVEQKEQKPWKVGANAYFTPEQKPAESRKRNKPKESWLSRAKYEIEHDDELLMQRQKELREIRELKKKEQHPSSRFLPGDWVVYDGPLGHAILQVKDVVDGRYTFVDNESTLLVEDSDKFLRPLTPKDVEGKQKPSAEYVLTKAGLKPYKDGNQWCILAGDNILEGICGFGDTIEDALYEFLIDALNTQKEQKPLTTEETELNSIAFLEQMGYTCIPPGKEQNPAEWSDEDREISQNIMDFLEEPFTASLCPQLRKESQDWLKSLPERFNLQPKQEWSEEDKQDFDDLIMRFEKSLRINRCYFTSYDVDWLKSKLNGNSGK